MATTTDNYRLVVQTQGTNRAKTQLEGVRRVAQGLGLAFGALQLGRGFITSIGLIRDFEFSMSRVRAISGATEKEFAALEQTARTLGATTIFSARQAAEGMIFLSQAGFTAGETVKVTANALKLAQAGALGLAEAADITAKTIRIFNLEAGESGRVADVLSKAAASSNTNVSQLGQALSFLGPVAKTLNIGLEETVALIGLTSDRGIQAGRAGTGLRQVLLSLVNPTTEAADKMRDLGINVEEVANRARSGDITGVLETLDAVFEDAGLAAEVFGRRAVAAGFAVGQNQQAFKDLTQVLKDSEGAAEEMARIMNDTLRGAMLSFRSAVEEAVLQIGDRGLLGGLREFIKVSAGVISAQNGMLDQFEKNNNVTKLQVSLIKNLSVAVDALQAALTVLIARYALLRLSAIASAVAIKNFATVAKLARFSILGIATAFVFFAQKAGAVEIEVLGQSVTRWQKWRATISGVIAAVGALFRANITAGEAYRQAFEESINASALNNRKNEIANALNDISKAAEDAGNSIQTSFGKGKEEVLELVNQFKILIADLDIVSDHSQELADILSGKINTDQAKALIEAYATAVPVIQDAGKAIDDFNEVINKSNITVEEAQMRQSELRKEFDSSQAALEKLYNEFAGIDDLLRKGAISYDEYNRRVKLQSALIEQQTRAVKEQQEEYQKLDRVVEESAEKQKQAIQSVLDVAESLIDAFDSITDRFKDKAELESEAAQLESDRNRLSDLRRQEAGRGDPDRAALAQYDADIIKTNRELIKVQGKLAQDFNDVSLAFDVGKDLFRTVKPLVNAFSNFGGFFNQGGVVPGRGAKPVLAHGGEAIFNPKQLNNLNRFISMQQQRSTSSVNVSVVNQSEQPISAQNVRTRQREDGSVDVSMEIRGLISEQIRNGGLDQEFQDRFDLNRRA